MYHIFLYFHKGVTFSPGRSRKKSVSLYARLLLFNVVFNSNFSWLQIRFDCSQLHNMCCNMLLHHSTRSQILIYMACILCTHRSGRSALHQHQHQHQHEHFEFFRIVIFKIYSGHFYCRSKCYGGSAEQSTQSRRRKLNGFLISNYILMWLTSAVSLID